MHPTLLVGPADWDPTRLPRTEFATRVDALWRALGPGVSGAVVFGSPRHHAELAYLTHFTPKLEPAMALLSRNGAPSLLVGGGANMLPAARPLTWVERLEPLRGAGKAIARWRNGLKTAGADGGIVLIGGGAMARPLHDETMAALDGNAAQCDRTAVLRCIMQCKSTCELDLIRVACGMLDGVTLAMREAWRAGAGVSATVLAGERAGSQSGAQDVRTLFSTDDGRTFRPFTAAIDVQAGRLPVHVGVRHDGYWAEGVVDIGGTPDGLSKPAHAMLWTMIRNARTGATVAELAHAARVCAPFLQQHPVVEGRGGPIGLAPTDAFDGAENEPLVMSGVYCLRVGVCSADAGFIASAMVAVTEAGIDVLWSSREQGYP